MDSLLEAGYHDPQYEGLDDITWQQWDEIAAAAQSAVLGQAPMMPFWDPTGEEPEHQETIFGYHTMSCSDFQNGFCSLHKKGKSTSTMCFCYHFDSQHRRPPADTTTGRILYWDIPCPTSFCNETSCPSGDECIFSHSREEISYHPAKYKTRRCNGRGCRGESICCFAHSEAELRDWAPERYSYWSIMSTMGSGRDASAEVAPIEEDVWPSAAAVTNEDWQRQLFPTAHGPATRHKQRFCASYPNVSECRRGAACAFAHSREEARTPLLSIGQEQQAASALTEEFFMYHFKTLWCPIGVQHDWQTCVYAHNYQDARRKVDIGYGPKPCPYWAKKDPNAEYAQRCPLGLRCPFSHGAKEQLYHPQYFRSVTCRDLRTRGNGQIKDDCPRGQLCAFFHNKSHRRRVPADNTNYAVPLKQEDLPTAWVNDFLLPPFRDAAPQNSAPEDLDDLLVGQIPLGHVGQEATSASDAVSYWCPPGAYWDPTAACAEEMLELATAMAGMCPPTLPSDEHNSPPIDIFSAFAMSSAGLLPDSSKYDVTDWRQLSPVKQASPRTRSDSGDPVDDASTQATATAGEDFLAAAGSLLTQAASRSSALGGAGPIGSVGKGAGTTASSSASSSPWMIPPKEPSWGPFGGSFDGYRGLLSAVSADSPCDLSLGTLISNARWDPSEPAVLPVK